jgi:hypothetical protein
MCVVCQRFEERPSTVTLEPSYGAVAQLVERHHGMVEVARSIRVSSTSGSDDSVGFMLAGLVAGEGCFYVSRSGQRFVADGSERLRFGFAVTMAQRDRALLELLRSFLAVGSLRNSAPPRPHWQPTRTFSITSCADHRSATIPFAECYLLPSAKREQFEAWKAAMTDYEVARRTKTRWGQGPSPCAVDGCDRPVRGRGLCRSHYYRATGW